MKRFLVLMLVAVIAGGLLVRAYLRSNRVTEQVTTQLEAVYGGPVRVGDVEIGLTGTTIRDFALYEDGLLTIGDHDEPWLKIASLNTDVSIWDFVNGNARPTRVTVTGATLVLRFDSAGNLLTRFPAQPPASSDGATGMGEPVKSDALPEAVIQGTVIFRKHGHPDLTLKNVNLQIANQEGRLALTGSADGAGVAKLALTGTFERDSGGTVKATVHLKTETKVRLTQSILKRLPFVPACVWEEIQIASGDATAAMTLNVDVPSRTFHYRVEVTPENTTLFVPSIGLSARSVRGNVTIDDQVVQLRNLRGRAFGGKLSTDGDLDFRSSISKLTFSNIKVEGLNVSELPAIWNIPASDGKLFGNTALQITIVPETLTPTLAGTLIGIAPSAPWLAPATLLAASPEAGVHVQSQGKAQVRDPAGKNEPLDFDWQLAPR